MNRMMRPSFCCSQPTSGLRIVASDGYSSDVVVEVLDRVLPVEDAEISAFAHKQFEKRGLKFRVPAVGNPDVYPPGFAGQTGSTFDDETKGTFGGYSSELGAVTLATPEPNAASKPAYAAGLPTVNYVAFFTTPLDVTTTDIPGGLVIGSAVVPTGTTVTFGGTLDNDLSETNGSTTIAQTNTGTVVPEPTSLCFLGLAGVAAFGRRRRA